jgi:hypothetical protein
MNWNEYCDSTFNHVTNKFYQILRLISKIELMYLRSILVSNPFCILRWKMYLWNSQ